MNRRPPVDPRLTRGPGDGDARDRSNRVRALGWALPAGVIMGLMVWYAAGTRAGWTTFFLVTAGASGFALFVSEFAGRSAGQLFHPGSSKRVRDYSAATALAAQGRYEEAMARFRLGAEEEPEDPRPCVEVARLYTRHLDDTVEALQWFREARRRGLSSGEERLVMREMVEAAERGGNGLLAAPDLARYAEEHEEAEEGEWARNLLAELKRTLADD